MNPITTTCYDCPRFLIGEDCGVYRGETGILRPEPLGIRTESGSGPKYALRTGFAYNSLL